MRVIGEKMSMSVAFDKLRVSQYPAEECTIGGHAKNHELLEGAEQAFTRNFTVIAVRKGQGDVALGNVIGSNIFNVLGILGITALVQPMLVPPEVARLDIWVMAAVAVLLCRTYRSAPPPALVRAADRLARRRETEKEKLFEHTKTRPMTVQKF